MVFTPRRFSLPARMEVTRGSTVTGEASECVASDSLRREADGVVALRLGVGTLFAGESGFVSSSFRVSSTHRFLWVLVMPA